ARSYAFTLDNDRNLVAQFTDVQKPTLTITNPVANSRLSNAVVNVMGTAKDNDRVANVWVSLNSGSFVAAGSQNNWTNWVLQQRLAPGTNVLRAYAADAAGNASSVATNRVVYVVSDCLVLRTNPPKGGTVTGVSGGQWLEINRVYTATAKSNGTAGFAFTSWAQSTNGTDWATSQTLALSFTMRSNLTLVANFADVQKPTLTITSPVANSRLGTAVVNVMGTVKDNVGVSEVWCQTKGVWGLASLGAGSTNWSIAVAVAPGTNIVKACAVDPTGNRSLTNTVSFVYVVSNRLSLIVTGTGTVSPNYSNALLELGKSYTITATPGIGFLFSGWVGTVSGNTVLSSNAPQLTFAMVSNLVLRATFVTNTFLAAKGTYNGLFYPASSQTVSNSGYFTLALTDKGGFTGRLLLAGTTNNFTGAFDFGGQAQLSVPRIGLSPLQLTLFLSATERSIDGWVRGSLWDADLRSDLAATNNAFAGSYTLLVPGSSDAAASPPGTGAGAVTVSASGIVTVSGNLADGTAIRQTTGAAADGSWPLYVSLYAGRGLLF
ncbi:MAG: Ig-like domain-containing protein, partial [Planctomycetota bacterium]|nr:Ig-like domain-containing protein [Planctomycetota bacterium]